jgi:hypothetical protein
VKIKSASTALENFSVNLGDRTLPKGCMARIPTINLSEQTFQSSALFPEACGFFFGGRGFGSALLAEPFISLEQAAHNVASAERIGRFRTAVYINEKLLGGLRKQPNPHSFVCCGQPITDGIYGSL